MKKRILFLCVIALFSCVMHAEEKLPVLKVSFEGVLNSQMTDYVNGTMELTNEDNTVVKLNAKFKTRGATARLYSMKPSLNMKLSNEDYSEAQDSTLLGLRSCSSWILDAMAIDRICMRNRVCFDIWNEFGKLPYQTSFDSRNGTVGKFVEMYINGTYFGIYCMTDKINRKLLDLKKVKVNSDGTVTPRGVLYKHGTQDIANQNERCFTDDFSAATISWHNAWELSEPDDYPSREAWEPLIDAYDNGNTMDYVRKYFHMDNLVKYQIFIMAMSIEDNWGNKNRYFSILNMQKDIDDPDPAEGARRKFIITPWDLDTSLGGTYNGSCYDGNYTNWVIADIMKNGVYPFSVCMKQEDYRQALKECWSEQRTGALSVENVTNKLYAYRDLFINTGAWKRMTDHFDNQKNKPCYVEDLSHEIDLIVNWYKARHAAMDDYFKITDDIRNINADTENSSTTVYDLSGRPVSANITSPGIYIRNGKKIIVDGK